MGKRKYLIQKLAQVLLTMLFILMFNFFLFRIMPGNPVTLLARSTGGRMTPAAQRELARDLGLDKPLVGQFVTYVSDTVQLNLGKSTIVYPAEDVTGIFVEFLRPTLILVGLSTIFSTVIGVMMGIYAGWNRGSRYDVSSMGFSLILYAMPEWWLGLLLLIFFAGTLQVFPAAGAQSVTENLTGVAHVVDVVNHLFLPCLTLTLAYLGEYYLLMRSSLLDVLGEEYITLARAKGLREKVVLWQHAVRNALLPTVTLVALNFGFVIGGAITVETVFSYPGLGKLTFDALQAKDYPLLQGMFLFFSLAVIIANFIADLCYAYLDPRVREA